MHRPFVPLALCLLATLWIADHTLPHPPPPYEEKLAHQKEFYEAIVETPPAPGQSGFKARLLVSSTLEPFPMLATFETVAQPGQPPHLPTTGDWIRFQAKLKRPTWYKNPGSFNYRRWLERQGVYLTGFIPADQWELLRPSQQPATVLTRIRGKLLTQLSQATHGEAREFLKAFILGDRSGLTSELWNDFQKTGTAHLIAISGQHVGMVAAYFFLICLFLLKFSERLLLTGSVKTIAALCSFLPAFGYVLIAGAPPSAIRALILLAMTVLALAVRRDFDIFSALALAALLIVLFDPSALFGSSFQLSFLAVLAMALLVPPLTSQLDFFNKENRRWVRWLCLSLAATIAATLGTAPLVAARFHLISVSGILTNLWAIPFSGLLLALTLCSLVGSWLLPPIGGWGLSLAEKLTQFFLLLIKKSSLWSVTLELFPTPLELGLTYLLLALLVLFLHKKIRPAWGIPLFVLLLAGFLPFNHLIRQPCKVTFIDVGQGDAALIVTPQGKTILLDAGGFLIPGLAHPFDVGQEVVVPFLKREGVRKLDLMILSHPHPDHYGGMQAVAQAFPIGEFWWNGQRFPDATFQSLLDSFKTNPGATVMRQIQAPYRTTLDQVEMEILAPAHLQPADGINNNCLVIKLTYGKTSFLFAGDIERDAEEKLVSLSSDLQATVLKIPHHGSRTSSSIPFIDAVSPQFAVVSLAEGNMFRFPHKDILERYERRGIKVYRTDQEGAIMFLSDKNEVNVRPNSPIVHTATQTPFSGASPSPDRPARPRGR